MNEEEIEETEAKIAELEGRAKALREEAGSLREDACRREEAAEAVEDDVERLEKELARQRYAELGDFAEVFVTHQTYIPGKGPRWNGVVRRIPEALDVPLRRRKPTRYFVNSMSDLFHEKLVETEKGRRFIAAVFGVMAATPQHTFQVLTKRPQQARRWFEWATEGGITKERLQSNADAALGRSTGIPSAKIWPLPNVWLGVSVEDQAAADERIPELLELPAVVRFLSCEPLLGPVDLSAWIDGDLECRSCAGEGVLRADIDAHEDGAGCELRHDIDSDGCKCHCGVKLPQCPGCADYSPGRRRRVPLGWVIAGGESGNGARPMHPGWARGLRDQCTAAGVPFFFKQWGAWREQMEPNKGPRGVLSSDGAYRHAGKASRLSKLAPANFHVNGAPALAGHPDLITVLRVGKKAAGSELDGRTWDEFPSGPSRAESPDRASSGTEDDGEEADHG